MTERTPGKWRTEPSGHGHHYIYAGSAKEHEYLAITVAPNGEADAAAIVVAVNSHEALLEALEGVTPSSPFYELTYHGGTQCGACGKRADLDVPIGDRHEDDCRWVAARAALKELREASE